MLFTDYSSAFNTIVPSKLIIKLEALGLNPALGNWVQDFLMGCPQVVKVGNNISTSLILNTGAPEGCVISPLLYSLFTYDCVAMHASSSVIRVADNTSRPDYQQGGGEGTRSVVSGKQPFTQRYQNKGDDCRLQETAEGAPLIHINGKAMGKMEHFKFLCVHITDKLKWSTHTDSVVKKAQQHLFNLRRLKKFGL
jgi:hypothetical protein